MRPVPTFIALSTMLALSPAAGAGERAKAEVDCKMTGEKLVYDCTILLMNRDSGDPIPGAKVSINANMPSMPMAHHAPPVTAKAMGEPGNYHARLTVEMHGEWALTIDVSGPLRDRLVKKLQLGPMSTMTHGEAMPKSE